MIKLCLFQILYYVSSFIIFINLVQKIITTSKKMIINLIILIFKYLNIYKSGFFETVQLFIILYNKLHVLFLSLNVYF